MGLPWLEVKSLYALAGGSLVRRRDLKDCFKSSMAAGIIEGLLGGMKGRLTGANDGSAWRKIVV